VSKDWADASLDDLGGDNEVGPVAKGNGTINDNRSINNNRKWCEVLPLMSSTRCRTRLATVTGLILTTPVCAATDDTDERHGITVFSDDTMRALLVYMIWLSS
jgi:hypothetical protein